MRIACSVNAGGPRPLQEKSTGGGIIGTVKSLLGGGGNNSEAHTNTPDVNVQSSHSKGGSSTATTGSYQSSTSTTKEFHSTNTYAVDTKVPSVSRP